MQLTRSSDKICTVQTSFTFIKRTNQGKYSISNDYKTKYRMESPHLRVCLEHKKLGQTLCLSRVLKPVVLQSHSFINAKCDSVHSNYMLTYSHSVYNTYTLTYSQTSSKAIYIRNVLGRRKEGLAGLVNFRTICQLNRATFYIWNRVTRKIPITLFLITKLFPKTFKWQYKKY